MENRHDDNTPVINDYTYYIFEEIEKRGLQFCLPPEWRPIYHAFLKERKLRRELARAFQGIVDAFNMPNGTESTRYSQDFGRQGTEASQENRETDSPTGPLEE